MTIIDLLFELYIYFIPLPEKKIYEIKKKVKDKYTELPEVDKPKNIKERVKPFMENWLTEMCALTFYLPLARWMKDASPFNDDDNLGDYEV